MKGFIQTRHGFRINIDAGGTCAYVGIINSMRFFVLHESASGNKNIGHIFGARFCQAHDACILLTVRPHDSSSASPRGAEGDKYVWRI
jgi:hypothetical protein